MKPRVGFSSALRVHYHDELERLLFFNPQQKRALRGIHHSVLEFGVPTIQEVQGKLRVSLEAFPEAQALFALEDLGEEPRLVGVMVYARVEPQTLAMLHIAVHQDFSQSGKRADAQLVPRFIAQLREIGRRIKGVETVDLKYARSLKLPVRPTRKGAKTGD